MYTMSPSQGGLFFHTKTTFNASLTDHRFAVISDLSIIPMILHAFGVGVKPKNVSSQPRGERRELPIPVLPAMRWILQTTKSEEAVSG